MFHKSKFDCFSWPLIRKTLNFLLTISYWFCLGVWMYICKSFSSGYILMNFLKLYQSNKTKISEKTFIIQIWDTSTPVSSQSSIYFFCSNCSKNFVNILQANSLSCASKSCWLRAGKKATLEKTLEIYLPSFWFKASQFASY